MSEEPLDANVEEATPGEQAVPVRSVAATSSEAVSNHGAEHQGASWREVRDNPRLLLSLLFFVTGALGLPVLWYSKAFSLQGKITLSFAVLAWTALLIWLTVLVCMWSYSRVAPVLQ